MYQPFRLLKSILPHDLLIPDSLKIISHSNMAMLAGLNKNPAVCAPVDDGLAIAKIFAID
jgi:hypothetical protein